MDYLRDYRGYMLYDPAQRKILISNDVVFFEADFEHNLDFQSTEKLSGSDQVVNPLSLFDSSTFSTRVSTSSPVQGPHKENQSAAPVAVLTQSNGGESQPRHPMQTRAKASIR